MASTKIRGITIELGADTTGLKKALEGINKEIGSTQKELKDVEKLLKIDPKNVELLEQKQRLLNDRIEQTKTKLNSLREAQKNVDLSTEEGQRQYDALTREIASCEAELKSLESQADKSKEAIKKIGEAGEKLQKIGGKISSVGDSMTRNVTVPIMGASAAIVKTAGDFEEQMAKVSSIAQAYGDDLDALKQKALELSETTRFSATEIGQAYEYMGMAGWSTNEILAGTPGILDLATASGEDLASVSDIVTDGLTAFGLAASDTSRFVNVLAEAARSSNTNVGLMGESFKYVGPVAGSMGYQIEDVAVALGLMANSGIKGSMAGTSLRNMLQRMAKPTKESQMAMDRLGLSLTDSSGNMLSLKQIMEQLRGSMNEINMPLTEYNAKLDELDKALEDGTIKQKEYDSELEELNKQAFGAEGAEKARAAAMLGGTRAMAALMAVASATEEDYNNLTSAIQNSGETMVRTSDGAVKPLNEALANGETILEEYNGTAAAMAGTMNDTTNVQMLQFKNQLQNLGIQLGETLLPLLQKLIDVLSKLLDGFNQLTPSQQSAIVYIGLIVAALGPLLSIGGRLITGIGMIISLAPAVAGAFSTVAGFVTGTLIPAVSGAISTVGSFIATIGGPLIAAIGLVIAAVVLWIKNWEDIKEATRLLIERTIEHFENLKKNVIDIFEKIKQGIKAPINGILGFIEKLVNGIINGINGMTSKLNSIGFSIPEWVPEFGGKDFHLSIPQIGNVSLPRLAEGGIMTRGSALVGEAGAELLSVNDGRAMVQPLGGQNGASELTALLETYLPYLAQRQNILLDGNTLVGQTAGRMNEALGSIALRSSYR